MKRRQISDIVDSCVQRLLAGENLERILSSYPDHAAELRPLLETALWTRSMNTQKTIPANISARSLARYRAKTEEIRRKPQKRSYFPNHPTLRFVTYTAVFIFMIGSLLVGTGFASAQSLPGETLYPVKLVVERARLNLATNSSSRLALEETFDQQRVTEVSELIQMNRIEQVSFAGFLEQQGNNAWKIAGVPVHLSSQVSAPIASLTKTYVEIDGFTGSGEVDVRALRLRLFHLDGTIDQVSKDTWVINGVQVKIDPNTHIIGTPSIGSMVSLSAIRVESSRLMAVAVRVGDSRLIPPPTPGTSQSPAVQ